jgi:trimethylamine--corrinoid protein Co-methyltransferase
MTQTPNGIHPNGGPVLHRLTPEQCQRIHEASLEILQRVGVRLFEQEALDLVKRAGAETFDGNRARISARLVEQALATAPKEVVLHDRHGREALRLGGRRSYYGTGSDCLNILDHRTGQRRKPILQDVVEGVTVCDALPNINFVMSLFLPTDVNQAIADRYQMEVMLNHTTKPLVYVTYEFSGCRDVVDMAEAVAGGAEALRAKPFLACYINVTSGLLHNEEALQKLLFLAGKGLPALYIPVITGGVNGPVTPAGALALVNAGVLAGLVVAQLKREGAPVIVPGWGGTAMDMRAMMEPYCVPDARGMAEAMAHFYGLPMFALAGCSDSKVVDQQAALEAALTLMEVSLVGGNLVHDLGYLESGLTTSLAQLLICHEIVTWIKYSTKPIEVNDETLALDLVEAAGPDGQMLDSEHTRQHFRERWYPDLIDHRIHDLWLEDGGSTLAERAARQVDEILAEHKPEALPAEAAAAVRAVVERAERQDAA